MKKPAASRIDALPQRSLWRLLGVMLLVIAPHLLRLPPWESAAVLALGVWRVVATRRQWPAPHAAIKAGLTILAFVGVYASFGRVWGQHPGVALLVIMLGLKLTELRARRDVVVTVFLLYFLLLTHFLFSQELWTLFYLLACTIAVTAVLADTHHAGGALPARLALRIGGRLIAQSLPLMLLMFLLCPRIPGPLWTLPDDAGAARSGLSETMSPGDVARLASSDEVAFRVRFEGAIPPAADRYWRGPVLWAFDGRSWSAPPQPFTANPPLQLEGPGYRYETTLEPSRTPWLFALDYADASALPERTRLSSDYELMSWKPVNERLRYVAQSQPRHRAQPDLSDRERRRLLTLPAGYNARARALAQSWQQAGGGDRAIVDRALAMFRDEAFFYTLEPPRLGRDSVDEFLFQTRRGFCEHYASSFVVLMRAAGLPARVVTGYLGAEKNPFGDHYVVRQSDAHAWAEVWIAGFGWTRIDPTATVSPARVEQSLGALGSGTRQAREGLFGALDWQTLRYQARSVYDWIDAQWNGLVLGYGTDLQRDLLDRIGLGNWRDMLLALTGTITATLLLIGGLMMRKRRPAAPTDAALRLWRQATRQLQAQGLPQNRGEGPRDFADRVARERPALAAPVRALARAYLQARYEAVEPTSEALRELRLAVDALKR